VPFNLVLVSYLALFGVGVFFGYGLMLGNFTERKTVYSHLSLDKKWNPAMIIVYGYGIAVSAVVYILMRFVL